VWKSFKLKKKDHENSSLREEIGYLSDIGKVREIDEDSVFVATAFSPSNGFSTKKTLMIVSDGMGGHSKGEVASYLATTSVAKEIVPKLFDEEKTTKDDLVRAIKQANSKILDYSSNHPECEGMGTTMTIALICHPEIYLAHVGDSRAYAILKNEIRQLTKDHSLVQEMVDRGEISKEEAKKHPQKNIITRVVGIFPDIEVETHTYTWKGNTKLFLCCDGLVNHVSDDEIKDIVLKSSSPNDACLNLIKLANERGGKDNISVILTPSLTSWF
jgi:PPM family protein phosphatase